MLKMGMVFSRLTVIGVGQRCTSGRFPLALPLPLWRGGECSGNATTIRSYPQLCLPQC
jgi:hypothetical protein